LQKWIEQINYSGELFLDYYVASWRFFRCSPVERSNHDFIKEHLQDSGFAPGQVVFPTWTDEVMGFRYGVLVRQDFEKGLRMADMYARRIAAKGSLDPEGELRADQKSIRHSWQVCGLQARIELCKDAGISIFAARRENFPIQHAPKLYAAMSEVHYGG